MKRIQLLKNFVLITTLLCAGIPTIDGKSIGYFDGIDKTNFKGYVKNYVKNYILQNSQNLYSIKRRSGFHFSIIDSVCNKKGLPPQLKYLAVIESELKTKAVSRAGAVGLWQLMPETGRILGLKINAGCDERKNDYKSTNAAVTHLKDLHQEFKDWLLVFAAYNCGEVPVYNAMRRSGSRDFWKLQSFLPAETRNYVKKFIASCYFFEGSHSFTMLSVIVNASNEELSKSS